MDMLTGYGPPLLDTEGKVGQHYKDLNNGDIYKCVKVSVVTTIHFPTDADYIWELTIKGDQQADLAETDETKPGYVKNRELITQLSEEIEEFKNIAITEPFEVTGSVVAFKGNAGSPVEIKGNANVSADTTVTLMHCGENIVDMSKFVNTAGNSCVQDGWIVLERSANSDLSVYKFENSFLPITPLMRPGKKYWLFVEFSSDTRLLGDGMASLALSQGNASEAIKGTTKTIQDFTGVNKVLVETKAEFADVSNSLRFIFYYSAGMYGTCKFRAWCRLADDDEKIVIDSSGGYVVNRVYNESYEQYFGEAKSQTLAAGHAGDYEWPALAAYDGINTIAVSTGTVTASGKTVKVVENSFDVSDYNIAVLTLDGDCADMTKDDYVSLAYTFQGMSGMVDVKKQGSSAISIGEAIGGDFDSDVGGLFNFTLKFQEAFIAKDGWIAAKKYCFKANAVDPSELLNVCSCKLWGEVVKSREAPDELINLPNAGAIDGFPCAIVLNGKFYCIGTFNIPKDGWMFESANYAPKAILCADAHVPATQFKALATLNGDFKLEYVEDESDQDWVLPSINMAIQAVMNSDGSDLDTTVDQYIDIKQAIDYYNHTVDECAVDCTDKNYILVTFDKVKWYFSVYDRDNTYGNGTLKTAQFYAPNRSASYQDFANVHRLMNLIFTHKRAELKARAIELRNGVKSEYNVTDVFTNFSAGFPAVLLAKNAERWPRLNATNVANLARILNWYRLRRAYLDQIIDSWS